MQPSERTLYLQVIAQMLIADGALSDAERAYLDGVMSQLELSADERRAALGGVSIDSPIEERIAGLGAAAKASLAQEIERAADADGSRHRREGVLLARVRAALGVATSG